MNNNSSIKNNQNKKDFIKDMEERNFIVQEGKFKYIDILKLCSLGLVDTCMGNNAVSAYALCLLPPGPDQNPAKGQKPPIDYDPNNPNNYPPNINFIAPGGTFKLRPDEAIVIIGKTPPPAIYFGFQSYLFFVKNKPEKDYSDYLVLGDDETGIYHRVFAAMGNSTNNHNIWTENTPRGETGFPYNSSTVIISSADQGVNQQIRDSLYTSGYSEDIMNDDIIPMDMVNMGLEKGKDHFLFLMRGAIWNEKHVGDSYIHNFDQFMKVYRVTPKKSVAKLDPWPVPKLKVRETGTTEFQIIPGARDDLDHLRRELINKYGNNEYNHIDLDTNLWVLNSYEGILQDVDVLGDGRDATYLKTDIFQLATDEDFVILYGVNHEFTRKAIYCNCSFYGDKFINGVAVANVNVEFPYSANEYFPEDYENAKYYYVCKMAREVDEDCLITIPYSTNNPQGKAFGVDNNEDAFIGFRLYLDQRAMVGPALFDIIWDRAILFTKKNKVHK